MKSSLHLPIAEVQAALYSFFRRRFEPIQHVQRLPRRELVRIHVGQLLQHRIFGNGRVRFFRRRGKQIQLAVGGLLFQLFELPLRRLQRARG